MNTMKRNNCLYNFEGIKNGDKFNYTISLKQRNCAIAQVTNFMEELKKDNNLLFVKELIGNDYKIFFYSVLLQLLIKNNYPLEIVTKQIIFCPDALTILKQSDGCSILHIIVYGNMPTKYWSIIEAFFENGGSYKKNNYNEYPHETLLHNNNLDKNEKNELVFKLLNLVSHYEKNKNSELMKLSVDCGVKTRTIIKKNNKYDAFDEHEAKIMKKFMKLTDIEISNLHTNDLLITIINHKTQDVNKIIIQNAISGDSYNLIDILKDKKFSTKQKNYAILINELVKKINDNALKYIFINDIAYNLEEIINNFDYEIEEQNDKKLLNAVLLLNYLGNYNLLIENRNKLIEDFLNSQNNKKVLCGLYAMSTEPEPQMIDNLKKIKNNNYNNFINNYIIEMLNFYN